MKKTSITFRLTLFHSLFTTLIALLVLGVIFYLSNVSLTRHGEANLKRTVEDNMGELEYDDGELDIEDFLLASNGVTLALFNTTNEMIYGSTSVDFYLELPFQEHTIQTLVKDNQTYLIYDLLFPASKGRSVWVRGITLLDEVVADMQMIVLLAFVFLPLLVAISILGSYMITKRELNPLNHVIQTAKRIEVSGDLSARIHIAKGSKEIEALSSTFDGMLSKLEESFDTEKQFTADVSHELRTPTAVILAECDYALGLNISLEDKVEALETIQRQAKKMTYLITELLKLSRMNRGIEVFEMTSIDFSSLVRELCDEQKLIVPHGIAFSYTIDSGIRLQGDTLMLSRLVINLMSNAFKYSDPLRIEKGTSFVHLLLKDTEEGIVLQIEDNGIGIDTPHLSKIWQRFYQIEKARTATDKGNMGLGLAMVMEIAKLHKATIEVDSTLGERSCFTVVFKK